VSIEYQSAILTSYGGIAPGLNFRTKNHQDRLIFEKVIQKIKMDRFLGHAGISNLPGLAFDF